MLNHHDVINTRAKNNIRVEHKKAKHKLSKQVSKSNAQLKKGGDNNCALVPLPKYKHLNTNIFSIRSTVLSSETITASKCQCQKPTWGKQTSPMLVQEECWDSTLLVSWTQTEHSKQLDLESETICRQTSDSQTDGRRWHFHFVSGTKAECESPLNCAPELVLLTYLLTYLLVAQTE